MDKRVLIYAPRAERDLMSLPKAQALAILDDLEILRHPPWPPAKVKRLRGNEYWEIKTGDYRTIFLPIRKRVVILRVVNRRDLEAAIDRIDIKALMKWMKKTGDEPGR